MNVLALLSIGAAAPGVYSSSIAPNGLASCSANGDWVTLFYYPPGTVVPDCGNTVGPGCPMGCASNCGEACGGCYAQIDAPQTIYGSVTGCTGSSPPLGSWILTLTSVVPFLGDSGLPAGSQAYTVHGTLGASLVYGEGEMSPGSNSNVTLSLTF